MYNPSVIWAAIGAVGMLKTAIIEESGAELQVGLFAPEEIDLDGRVTVSRHRIEYQTADAPDLRRSIIVVIDSVRYSIYRPPRRTDDGFFSVAELEVKQ
ncbi:hypothetical protein [Burkholderia pseudomallei]|uniref:head-tail joining protein n=1 Tax=Burkholderia pseudomallei TaxID=28450 RepID=UPI00014F91FA|nr:hypothetical protein [Burkholderia pseudomallei]AGR71915.1 hypothetical protein BDL_3050 [Burkholderia pseudomallei MSHR305]AHK66037.1 hypothetical protein BBX_1451 [Burkholderia pseudomallei MSHR520]AIP79803.1 hypothetical protein JE55_573 [Burkholderia pseudomallei]APZ19442.1 hypothetical protein BGI47_12770 [Burkholderia pseudomallei]APZ25635.1 hypothetical protein BGI46_12780 [Burkholderia pseudomallei]